MRPLTIRLPLVPATQLFSLREQHAKARPPGRGHRELLFHRAMWNGHAIAVFIEGRLAIDEEYVMVGAVSLNMMQRHVPGIQGTVSHERHLLPVRERAGDLHGSGLLRLSVGKTPSKYLGKNGFSLGSTLKGRSRFRD